MIMILLILDVTGLSVKRRPREYQRVQTEAKRGSACQIEGTVEYYERKPKAIYIYLEEAILNVHSERFSIPKVIIKYSGEQGFLIGNRILLTDGKLEAIPRATNQGQFDARKYYQARNIDFFVSSKNMTIVDANNDKLRGRLYNLRESFSEKIHELLPNDNGGVLSAMLTSDKTFLEEETKVRYQMSGLMHIISISALHFSILGMGCHKLLTKIGTNYYVAAVIAIILMLAYGVALGGNIPATRALIMFSLYLGARFVGRTYDMLSALALSAILLLAEHPEYLYDIGFQLSFAAILGIGIVYPLLKGEDNVKKDQTRIRRLARGAKEGLLSGIAIWLVTVPILLSAYYEVSIYGIIVNLLVIPTAGVLLVSGLLGGSLGFLSITVGKVVILPASIILTSIDGLGRLVQQLPYATLILGQPPLWKCLIYYLVIIIFLIIVNRHRTGDADKKKNFKIFPVAIGLSVLLTLFWGIRHHEELVITALDVGQGDALVITTPAGKNYLIDGGSSSVKEVGKYRIIPYLKSQGIRNLEAVLVTHPDDDHLNGVMELFASIRDKQTSLRVKKCILPWWMSNHDEAKELLQIANEAKIEVVYVGEGDYLKDGEVVFEFLHPAEEEGVSYEENTNEGSLTFVLDYREFEAVFTGDLCGPGEVVVTDKVGECELLKVSHHGSKNSTDMNFLKAVRPTLSIISCSERNSYGHPHPDLMERLEVIESEVYLTKETGAVTIKTDGLEKIEVKGFIDKDEEY